MGMKNAGATILAILVLVSASWGTDNPPKKFHTSSPHPHHSLAQTGQAGHARSNASSTLQPRTQSERTKEVQRLEHQNAMTLQTQSRQRSGKVSGQASRNHPEATGRSSGINFSYHPPQNKSAATSGGRKH
jgi:hypothetical protein